jgi:hypothetical protein
LRYGCLRMKACSCSGEFECILNVIISIRGEIAKKNSLKLLVSSEYSTDGATYRLSAGPSEYSADGATYHLSTGPCAA